jgi:hypothetical protein
MKKLSEKSKIFFHLHLKVSAYCSLKVLDKVNEKILVVPDNTVHLHKTAEIWALCYDLNTT